MGNHREPCELIWIHMMSWKCTCIYGNPWWYTRIHRNSQEFIGPIWNHVNSWGFTWRLCKLILIHMILWKCTGMHGNTHVYTGITKNSQEFIGGQSVFIWIHWNSRKCIWIHRDSCDAQQFIGIYSNSQDVHMNSYEFMGIHMKPCELIWIHRISWNCTGIHGNSWLYTGIHRHSQEFIGATMNSYEFMGITWNHVNPHEFKGFHGNGRHIWKLMVVCMNS